jgi:HTH-type transcriptional regulator / antitoxin HigA
MDSKDITLPPSKYIKDFLDEREWSQKTLASILGWQPQDVSSLMNRKKKFTEEVAQQLADVFNNAPKFWADIEGNYRTTVESREALRKLSPNPKIKKRSALLSNFPTKEMQNRGWISKTDDLDKLAPEIEDLISRGEKLQSVTSFKRTIKNVELNKPENLWLGRSMVLAEMLPVEKYDETRIPSLFRLLRKAAKSSQAVHKVAELLQRYGIRFVVNQKLKTADIDGAAFWLNEQSPVVTLSLRFNNIGSFWFALMHELTHIKYRDSFSLDNLQNTPTLEIEKRANNEAANFLVPQEEMELFIKDTAPYYSKVKIIDFATKMQVHPGIIVGQLQKRQEIGYNTHHEAMVAVRELTTRTAFTDGWGLPVPQVRNKE